MSLGLTWRHTDPFTDVFELAGKVRAQDMADMKTHGMTAEEALAHGFLNGPCWSVLWNGDVIGMGGYTKRGRTLWSLWRDLTEEQSKAIMGKVTHWCRAIRLLAGPEPLWNVYTEGNRLTYNFLRASHCVDIALDKPLTVGFRTFIPFYLKPYAELVALEETSNV